MQKISSQCHLTSAPVLQFLQSLARWRERWTRYLALHEPTGLLSRPCLWRGLRQRWPRQLPFRSHCLPSYGESHSLCARTLWGQPCWGEGLLRHCFRLGPRRWRGLECKAPILRSGWPRSTTCRRISGQAGLRTTSATPLVSSSAAAATNLPSRPDSLSARAGNGLADRPPLFVTPSPRHLPRPDCPGALAGSGNPSCRRFSSG